MLTPYFLIFMCGIAGMWRWDGRPVEEDRLRLMAGAIADRGPDGEGIWTEGGIGLAHRRLAIIDVSARGAQPMVSADERYVVTFNGEIYNYQDLRRDCEERGNVFRSDSDTEVLLHLYARKGEKMLADLRGMFAFAIWDRETRRLFVARDRLGKKPFFYKREGSEFSFASDIRALTLGDQRPSIDWSAVRVFLGLQYVPAPMTGFAEIECLPPGYAGVLENGSWRTWKYDDVLTSESFGGTFTEAKERITSLLEESVRLRLMASDVPVGAFLSGGVDSSAVVSLMMRHAAKPISTFTMGFPSIGFDEREQAAAFAKQLGTDHHAFEVQGTHAAEMVDTLVDLYAAPYADSSALPTWMLARETAKHVKVVLTGDGADELFAGYRRHAHLARALWLARHGAVSLTPWLELTGQLMKDARLTRFARTLYAAHKNPQKGYAALFTGAYFSAVDEGWLLQKDFAAQTASMSAEGWMAERLQGKDPIMAALSFDRSSYLPDDLNVKMDRATMAHGLEARAPFLDQELVHFVSSLPTEWLLHRGRGKYILKEALKGVVPKEVLSRKKRGFQVPLARWFRGELRPLIVERCLASGSSLQQVCDPASVKRLLEENDRGTDHGNRLWMLLTLATWLNKNS